MIFKKARRGDPLGVGYRAVAECSPQEDQRWAVEAGVYKPTGLAFNEDLGLESRLSCHPQTGI